MRLLKRLRRQSLNLEAFIALLYSNHVKGSYRLGFKGEIISCIGEIVAFKGGAPKKMIDILGLVNELLAIALCFTLSNLPFVNTYKF